MSAPVIPARLRRAGVDGVSLGISLAMTALLQAELLLNSHVTGAPWANAILALGITLPLALRRRHVLEALVVIVVSALLLSLLLTDITALFSTLLTLMIASYFIGENEPSRRANAGLALALAVVVAVDAIGHQLNPGDLFFPMLLVTAAWLLGSMLRSRVEATAQLRRRAQRLEREREELAGAAIADERARLARELHDVVAHSVSVMVVQAGAARTVLDRSPDEALTSLGTVERTGREALGELRRVLGMLRPEEEAPELSPQPGLSTGLGDLVERARRAGLPVELHVDGTPRPLATGIDLTAYRIVQEALTNTLKHAGPAHARVDVRWGEDELRLEVRDTGNGPGRTVDETGAGLGLVGMRERVALAGGRLDTGPARGGGFRVRAVLPQGEIA